MSAPEPSTITREELAALVAAKERDVISFAYYDELHAALIQLACTDVDGGGARRGGRRARRRRGMRRLLPGRHPGGGRADQGVERRDHPVVQARLLVGGPVVRWLKRFLFR